jgi:hypothetical protein
VVECSDIQPHGMIASWPKLSEVRLERVRLHVREDSPQAICALESLWLSQVFIVGRLAKMLAGSTYSLRQLKLIGITDLSIDDVLAVLETLGGRLVSFALRSCRFAAQVSTTRSFDRVFAMCDQLESVDLDLLSLPIESPCTYRRQLLGRTVSLWLLCLTLALATLFAAQKKLRHVELRAADWIHMDDWLTLFGASSPSINELLITVFVFFLSCFPGRISDSLLFTCAIASALDLGRTGGFVEEGMEGEV